MHGMALLLILFFPVCDSDNCPNLEGINGGEVMTNDPNCAEKAIAKYTCNEGYCPEGDTIRCCVEVDGLLVWSGDPPTCVSKLHLVFNTIIMILVNMTRVL